jgi:hypothetical protein
MSNGELRRQAERLLFLALHARERGNLELADELTARAMRLFDETSGLTNIPESQPTAQPPPTAVPQQKQQQQEQQTTKGAVQSKEDGEEK